MIYVTSDIHGEFEKFRKLVEEEIQLKEEDVLYVLGDVIDRGPHPIKVLRYMMAKPNIFPIIGNHELMAYFGLNLALKEVTAEFTESLTAEDMGKLADWMCNGGESTLAEFSKLSPEEREYVMEYLEEFEPYAMVSVEGINYLLVHAAISNFSPGRSMDDYDIDELVWERVDFERAYSSNYFAVSGHTPTQMIIDNPKPGYIFRKNNHIAIDCGACFEDGQLAALCLDTGKEYYVR